VIRQEWLQPAAPEAACGPNLEYDGEFLALEDAARGRPEQQYGATVIAAQEPDWPDVVKRASKLLDRSRDLRIVLLLARGLTRIEGLAGLRDALGLARDLLANFWEPLHPQLEFDGESDPVLRMNALTAFTNADDLLHDVRQAAFLRSSLGTITVRDVEAILNPGTGAAPVTAEQLRGAVRDAITADAGALAEAGECIEAIGRIRATLLSHLEPSLASDFTPLVKTLQIVADLVADVRAKLAVPAAVESHDGPARAAAAGDDARTVVGVGDIRSREDAIRALERVCDFLARNEPTNPAPLLIRRAQRVMTMPFLDIIRELAPDAAGQVENITGTSQA
jgi:type VI secretion system protein ImpA